MKNSLRIIGLTVASVGIFGSSLGAAAAITDKAPAHLDFEKGGLDLVPINPNNPSGPGVGPIVPTLDFGKIEIGNTDAHKVKEEGKDSQSRSLLGTGVGNYIGDGSGWVLSVVAEDFISKDVPSLQEVVFDFSKLSAKQVIDGKGLVNLSGNKKVTTGKGAVPIFTTEKGDIAAGKFQFDYRQTALQLPDKAAQSAKPKAYQSTVTWNLSAQSMGAGAQQAAVPLR